MKTKSWDPRITQKVLEMVASHYQTTPEAVKSDSGNRSARNAVMYILKEELGAPVRASRESINVKWDPMLYQAVKAVKAALPNDKALKAKIEEIKTEVLMITAMPGDPTQGAGADNGEPTSYRRRISPPASTEAPSEGKPVVPSGDAAQIIGKVQKAVTGVLLGADLLQSPDPAADVLLAKDMVVFLVWDDFPKISQAEILSAFHLDQTGFHRAIGRISVGLREEGSELKKKLRAVRAVYSN